MALSVSSKYCTPIIIIIRVCDVGMYVCRGVCMLTEDPDDITECVPLCELRGMGDLCPCVEEQYECLVCCRSTDPDDESCAPLPDLVPLSNHSLCSEGVCLGVSVPAMSLTECCMCPYRVCVSLKCRTK